MLNRRDLLLSASAASLLPMMGAMAQAIKPSSTAEAAKMNALFDAFVQEQLERSPETATSLGLDKDRLVGLKSRLSDVSLAASAKERTDNARRIKQLKAIDRHALTGLDAANYDTVMFVMAVEDEGNRAFDYGGGGSGAPYILSQLTGGLSIDSGFSRYGARDRHKGGRRRLSGAAKRLRDDDGPGTGTGSP